MNPSRRQVLLLSAGALALPLCSRPARAAPYPPRPVRVIVPYPPGGPADIIGRPLFELLSERLGQPFVAEYKPGAGSNIGTEALVRSAPDGLILLLTSSAQAINATLYRNLPYNFIGDTAPVASVSREALVLVVTPTFPARTAAEFVAYAKSRAGEITMASAGNGTTGHLAGELFMMKTGVKLNHVPFRGAAPALTALIGAQVQTMFVPLSAAIEQIRSGQLRALGVTTMAPLPLLPGVPALADNVPGYEASYWNGIVAPRGTPPDIVATLNRETNAALASPQLTALMAKLGISPLPGSAAQFAKLIADETEKWAAVIRFAGISVS